MKRFCFLLALVFQGFLGAVFIDDGFSYYQQGEKAEKPEGRKEAFNKALSSYLRQMSENPSGLLLYDIGNCYYQLGEYGLASLYYYRAEKLLPREEKIRTNLSITARKVGFEPPKKVPFFLFFHAGLSVYERSLGLLASLLFAFAFFSFNLWHATKAFFRLAIVATLGALFFSVSLLWSFSFAPVEAVVLGPTPLFQGPGEHYAKVKQEAIVPGNKVRVIEVVDEASWMQVELQGGQRGFVAAKEVEII